MSPGRLVLIVAALFVAGFTAFAAQRFLAEQRVELPAPVAQVIQAAPSPEYKMVLVTQRPLYAGSFVSPEDFEWQEWPDVSVPDSYFVEGERDPEELAGAVARRDVFLGQPVTEDGFVKPGDRGFLAAVLDPDMRAVSVPVDDASSNAGLIYPGDHVDLIVTQNLDTGGEGPNGRRVSETVLHDVRVIAMGRRLGNDPEVEDDRRARTTTLEVTPEQAEIVALVTELGKLSLSLRSLARSEDAETDAERRQAAPRRFTWDEDVSAVLRPENQPTTKLTVIRGADTNEIDVKRGIRP